MSYTAVDAIKDALRGQLEITEKTQSERRYDICQACPHFQATLTCGKCGCFMPAKVKLAQAECPDNRW